MAIVAPEARPQERGESARRREPQRPIRRSLSERLTLNLVVGLVAALLAFVLAASLLNDRREMVTVAVANERIPAGAAITPEMVRQETVPADTGFNDALVSFEQVQGGSLAASRTIPTGEPLTNSAVGSASSAPGQRVMAIPLDASQAVNGDLNVGDDIDVIEATKDGSKYVLTNAAVVGRSDGGESGGLGGATRPDELVILVEVDSAKALELASAIETGTIMVVRSTGAPPVEDAIEEGG